LYFRKTVVLRNFSFRIKEVQKSKLRKMRFGVEILMKKYSCNNNMVFKTRKIVTHKQLIVFKTKYFTKV
jgi:hypothetical protein